MLNLFRNNKGGVTVFVTLMLIPMILISGSAVDLARVYAARSILQDANQLAGNAILSQYYSALQDVYGLYGVMEEDPILGDMLREYIQLSVFGEEEENSPMGTFRLFYGETPDVGYSVDKLKNLGQAEVLRRQIEEYAKFRAPAIIMSEILERLDKFNTLAKDAEVIKQKLEVDERISELEEIYMEIYENIQEVHKYLEYEKEAFALLNADLGEIKREFDALHSTREEYHRLKNSAEEELSKQDRLKDLEEKLQKIMENIKALVEGGSVQSGWQEGDWNDDGTWGEAEWTNSSKVEGLNHTITESIKVLEEIIVGRYPESYGTYGAYQKPPKDLTQLMEKCERAQIKKRELKEQLDKLKESLEDPSEPCSEELRDGLTKPVVVKGKKVDESILDSYEKLLAFDVDKLGQGMFYVNVPIIKEVTNIGEKSGILDSVVFGEIQPGGTDAVGYSISRQNLTNLLGYYSLLGPDKLDDLKNISNYRYTAPQKFVTFFNLDEHPKIKEKFPELSGQNQYKKFYEALKELAEMQKKDNGKTKKIKNKIGEALKKAKSMADKRDFTPAGAKKYTGSGGCIASTSETGREQEDFMKDSGWGGSEDKKNPGKRVKKALSLVDQFKGFADLGSNKAGEFGDKILLLTYDAEMFSNFKSPNPDDSREPQLTMSGVEMNKQNNYFFQSELEYLVHGDETSAQKNIVVVAGLVFLVRFVFNYISTFTIPEIQQEITEFSAVAGGFAVLVRELLRLGYTVGESAIDMDRLVWQKEKRGVVLIKIKFEDWSFSVRSLIQNTVEEAFEEAQKKARGSKEEKEDDPLGLTYYIDYVRIFLLLKSGDELAKRTKNLIQWNITNKVKNIGADEDKMAAAELFCLNKAHTDFKITTTAQMRMLFLSMPVAQRGINGVIPPRAMGLEMTDYRGY